MALVKRCAVGTVLMLLFSACATTVVEGQRVPPFRRAAKIGDFDAATDVAVLHYYGAGGWGILWQGRYLVLAPYFSNHGFAQVVRNDPVTPNTALIELGLANTPIGRTEAVLIGHGHIDHAGDIPALIGPQAIPVQQAGLIADESTVNLLHGSRHLFRCVHGVRPQDQNAVVPECVPKGFRVTALHSAHAPHINLFDVDFEMFGGIQWVPRGKGPERPRDFLLGTPLAYLIDLLDNDGHPVFRIHYMDAAASPPHALVPPDTLSQRPIDVHIACVAGYNYESQYPEVLVRTGQVRYVLAGHWEDFFRSQKERLIPVRNILDEAKLNTFVNRVTGAVAPEVRALAPLRPCAEPGACGPRGNRWALPVPGDTFHFQTDG